MSSELLVIVISIAIGFAVILFLLHKWINESAEKQKPSNELIAWLKSTNQRLDISSKTLNERLDNSARIIADVQKNIGEMNEIGRGMKELQEFLQSPKLRGNIGERVLKELLGQMLPKQSFHLQYKFKSGATVDAAIKLQSGIIPIDSKFPMENFRKLTTAKDDGERKIYKKEFENDIKKHTDDISRKYILTEEGTIDYALMYIPSESVYYEIVNNPDLFEYAGTKRVLPVSPTTFYAYLRAIMMSLEGQKIEEQAKRILQTIRAVQKDYEKVDESINILQRHVSNAYNQMNNVLSSFTLLGQKLSSTSQLEEKAKQIKIE